MSAAIKVGYINNPISFSFFPKLCFLDLNCVILDNSPTLHWNDIKNPKLQCSNTSLCINNAVLLISIPQAIYIAVISNILFFISWGSIYVVNPWISAIKIKELYSYCFSTNPFIPPI